MGLKTELFLTFAKIGFFTFGGGYAMFPVIEDTCVEKKDWITHDDMMNITVIAESTPGPVAINCATFVGYKQKGVAGAAAATAGMILPSFIVILLIAFFLDRFLNIPVVANAFRGIKLAVGILIMDAAFRMMKKMKKEPLPTAILIAAAVIMFLISVFSVSFSSVVLMLLAGVVSLAVYIVKTKIRKEGEQ